MKTGQKFGRKVFVALLLAVLIATMLPFTVLAANNGNTYGTAYKVTFDTKYIFDPKLTCDKTLVNTNEEITFEYSGLSPCDSVKICFEKNGKVYYEAENSSSRIHKYYFVNPGEYYVFAKD